MNLCPMAFAASGTERSVTPPSASSAASNPLQYFRNSYQEARSEFLKNLNGWPPSTEHQIIPVPSKTDQDLFIDSVYIPATSGRQDRLLILTSGVHGIEGFLGSALQIAALKENFWGLRDENLSVLLIHAVNPYGFKHERRVSEANVDLNRNFDVSTDLFAIKNEGYRKIRELFNPPTPATSGFFSRFYFYTQAIQAILQHSMASLRAAVLSGQYEFPTSIFFGGQAFEPQKEILEKLLLKYGAGSQHILLVDLHTGYGARGKLHLFADRSPKMDASYLENIFAGKTLDYGQQKDFYQVTGSFVSFAAKIYADKKRFAPIVFEFGTMDSQKTLGSIDSVYRMTVENQLVQNGSSSDEDRLKIRRSFREMFYPSSPEWRSSALSQFRESLQLALKNQKRLASSPAAATAKAVSQ